MTSVVAAITAHASTHPGRLAFRVGEVSLDYPTLQAAVTRVSARLDDSDAGTIALAIENGATWAITDIAALESGKPCLPLPPFFTPAQQGHALRDAGADRLLTDRPEIYASLLREQSINAVRVDDIELENGTVAQFRLFIAPVTLPAKTAKITYTSGTTGTPKGACLCADTMELVAHALAAATKMTASDRHLCLLPLATLLENIAGIYAPLISGACVTLPAGGDFPEITGSYGRRIAGMLDRADATTAILIPQMLLALVSAIESGTATPTTPRFLAVGGARVSPVLLERAVRAGLPVMEGYGLSECASVVALNTPEANRRGSVGRPLPHVRIGVAGDGEILIRGATFLGYAGDDTTPGETLHTGDLGHIDTDGFLHLTGRKKHLFITAFGRNVAPDWIESELAMQPAIAQAWVHGEARPWNSAVIVAARGATAPAVTAAIAAANRNLPGYAQIRHWLPALEPFSGDNGELTANGRLRRDVIAARYAAAINQLYLEHDCEFS